MAPPAPGDPSNPFQSLLGDLMNMLGTSGPAQQWEMIRSFALSVATGGTPEANVEPVQRIRLEQLVDSGEVSHGWLGVRASNATYDTTSQTTTVSEVGPDTTPFGGARLDSFDPDSPAASAGMLPGDVITAVDGGQVQSTVELATRLYAEAPGTVVEITYQRGNSGPFTTWVTLTAAGGGAPVLSSSP